jgi:hypothetical protein
VPSSFAFCYLQPDPSRLQLEPSLLLSLLPAPAEELLGSRKPEKLLGAYCWKLKTSEARAVAGPLERSGLERWAPAWVLGFDLAGHGLIAFEPVMPGGEWSCTPCG